MGSDCDGQRTGGCAPPPAFPSSSEWDHISHMHKGLIDPSLGKTGYYIKEAEYPARVVSCALKWDTLLRRAALGKT